MVSFPLSNVTYVTRCMLTGFIFPFFFHSANLFCSNWLTTHTTLSRLKR
uniref:Uncharacterized protein n=1 Tax=Arundo donax TaxID=35708 RepID=A0A0A8XV15_ARUDO